MEKTKDRAAVHTTVSQSPQWIVATSTGHGHLISRPPKPTLSSLEKADPLMVKPDGQPEFGVTILEVNINSSRNVAVIKAMRFMEPAGEILYLTLFQDGTTTNRWPGTMVK